MDDEPTGGIDTDISVVVGGSVSGDIEVEGDIDYVAVDLIAGVTYQFDLEGQYTLSGTQGDPFLGGIFNSENVSVAAADDDGGIATHSRIIFTPSVSGTYYVAVSHFDNPDLIDIGTYTLYVAEEALSERPDPITFDAVISTGSGLIDGLTASQGYGSDNDGIARVTYSYPQTDATFVQSFDLDEGGPDLTQTNTPISAAAISFFEAGLAQISSYANIEFSLVVEDGLDFGTIRLSGNSAPSGNTLGIAGFPSRFPTGGDIFLFESFIGSGGRLSFVTLHELGHAIGLTHAQDDLFPDTFEGAEFTLMVPSFTSVFFPTASRADFYPTSFAYADILAIRQLYGADASANGGNNVYTFDLGTKYWETIFDLGGTDTIQITGSGSDVSIDLRPDNDALGGRFINVGTTITYFDGFSTVGARSDTVFVSPETVIENIITADGNDFVVGNSADNTIEGRTGNDRLLGEAGDDVIIGGDGADSLNGGEGNDAISGGDGNDQIFAGATDTGNDTIVGDAGDDVIGGNAGDDFLVGGGHSGTLISLAETGSSETDDGSDTLYGGAGNDTLIGGGYNDTDGIYQPSDAVMSGLEGNTIYSGTGDDQAFGAAGDDILGGGTGNDTLIGGAGNDTIFGGSGDTGSIGVNDVVNSGDGDDYIAASGGNDQVNAGNGNDIMFGGAGNDTINGGAGNDTIYGSAGDDSINGGSGQDTIRGSVGNDSLSGGDDGDTFIFKSGDGDDIVSDFEVGQDTLILNATETDFTDTASVQAAATETIINSQLGLLIDTGGGDSVFLAGITSADLTNITFVLS